MNWRRVMSGIMAESDYIGLRTAGYGLRPSDVGHRLSAIGYRPSDVGRRASLRKRRDDRGVVAGADVGGDGTGDRRGGKRAAGEHVVDAPADVALAEVPPGCPPGK